MNVRILVCDDDAAFAEKLSRWLQDNTARELHPEVCISTDPSILGDSEISSFDIIFLDIDMGQSNGVEVARRLRRLQARALLIFVTNYVEYSPEGYEVGAFRFLLKSRLKEKLPAYYEQALRVLQRREDVYTYALNGEVCRVRLCEVLYLESRGRLLCLHTVQKDRAGRVFTASWRRKSTAWRNRALCGSTRATWSIWPTSAAWAMRRSCWMTAPLCR